MAHFHIENLGAYNGDHEIDIDSLTNRELHTIKKISGLRAGEFEEAFLTGDNDVLVAFLVIVLERKGHKPVNLDAIWDAPSESIDFVIGEEEQPADDASPPSPGANESEKSNSSGDRSSNVSALPVNDPSRTGAPSSVTGSDSVPQTSAI